MDYLLLYAKAKARDLNYLSKKPGKKNEDTKLLVTKIFNKESN